MVYGNIDGVALSTLVGARRLEVTDCLKIGVNIIDALALLHRENVIHLGISPHTILVSMKDFSIRFCDLSRARTDESQVTEGDVADDMLPYISPEQTGRIDRNVDSRSDLYSLGAVLYEITTGQAPFASGDPLETIHNHIARTPPLPSEVNRNIPPIVSDIIMKLLSKNPADRYQSAYGLRSDLDKVFYQITTTRRVRHFPLGQDDSSEQFTLPDRLYGRDDEIGLVVQAYERVCTGACEMILVSGPPGVGKTALAQETNAFISDSGGYFLSGKFDNFQKTRPYTALITAFEDLIHRILMESEEEIRTVRERLHETLGSTLRVIIDLIPEVERITGQYPAIPGLDPVQTRNRFNRAFTQFVGVCATEKHPLVIFLDDLQWADSASLNLIKQIFINNITSHILLLGAARSDEISDTHILSSMMKEIAASDIPLGTIELALLSREQIAELCADVCRTDRYHVEQLAALIRDKTAGNPFFVIEFLKMLVTRKILHYDYTTRRWQWDIEQVSTMAATENVIELLTSRINDMSGPARQVLQYAACIGTECTLDDLAGISKYGRTDTSDLMNESCTAGLILCTPGETEAGKGSGGMRYRFLHDRVRQAVYNTITEDEKKRIHLEIGHMLCAEGQRDESAEQIFRIVHHYNTAVDLVDGSEERVVLSKMNLDAGKRAMDTNANDSALNYLRIAHTLLPAECWKSEPELSWELLSARAESEFLDGNGKKAQVLFGELEKQCKTLAKRMAIINKKVILHTSVSRHREAVDIGIEGLRTIGVTVDSAAGQTAILVETLRTLVNRRFRKVEALYRQGEMKEGTARYATGLLMNIAPSAYLVSQDLFVLIALMIVNYSMRYGNTTSSAVAYGFYGMIVGSILGNFKGGDALGRLALRLHDKYSDPSMKGMVYFVFGTLINHWRSPIDSSFDYLRTALNSSLEAGDFLYAGWSIDCIIETMIMRGISMDEIYRKSRSYADLAHQTKIQHAIDSVEVVAMLHEEFNGTEQSTGCFLQDDFDVETRIKEEQLQIWFCILKCQISFLFGKYETALEMIGRVEKKLDVLFGLMTLEEFYFYKALVLCACAGEAVPKQRRRYVKDVSKIEKKLKKFADNCPENFFHKYMLVAAEHARIDNNVLRAAECYDRAIERAGAAEFRQDEAIANELAGLFYIKRGKPKIARAYMTDAYRCYGWWGCRKKIRKMEQEYPRYFAGRYLPYDDGDSEGSTQFRAARDLDIHTIIKALQAISGEIILEKLLTTMMKIVIENAGAQRGCLILDNGGELLVQAHGDAETGEIEVLESIPVEELPNLPNTVIHYVARSARGVVLPDASSDGLFKKDAYISSHRLKSLLCEPLIKNDSLIGILYLENNLTTNAFTAQRVHLLRIIAAQAVISIENARYHTLQINALQSKIKPHFLFNALSSIAELTTEDPARAENAIVKLSGLYRFILNSSEKTLVSLDDEIEIVKAYLLIQKLRYGEKLTFSVESTGPSDCIALPGLSILPLVENSIKHGIAPRLEGGNVSVRTKAEESTCTIVVSDNGIGFNKLHPGTGHGLKNVQQRLTLVFGDNYSFSISQNDGITVKIAIPIKERV
jgi:predicted ATPase/GAF domain-containing protein